MAQFEPKAKEIQKHGSLVYIAAQRRGGVAAMNSDAELYLKEHPISFPFLLDEDRDVTHAYGVHVKLNVESINIARPSTFVINREGIVRYIHVGSNQTDRAELRSVLEALRAAKSAAP